ncbi:MAG TPA: WD40 repeat domain-containing protein [Ktedonobacteraceae bacterium]
MKTRRPPCLEWREKLALRHEDLSAADQLALDAHVHGCQFCSEALADYHFFEARLDALAPPAIKPLPRLSPHFFEQASRGHIDQIELPASITQPPVPVSKKPARKPDKIITIFLRTLSVAAVICLLLSAGAIFRVVSLSRLATHPSGDTLFNFNQHTGLVNSVGWSPDGKYIATASADHTVKVWNAQSGDLVCSYAGNDDIVYALAWSPNSQLIASGGGDSAVQIWNATTCTRANNYPVHTEDMAIRSVAWSHNGKYIATATSNITSAGITQIWDASTGKTLHTFSTSSEFVVSVAWSPDDQKIAIGTWKNVVQILDVQSEQQLYYNIFTDVVNSVAWSPNGLYLAIGIGGPGNGIVNVINTDTQKLICTYTKHIDGVNTVAWSPDGKYLASGSDDKTVRVWNPFSTITPTLMVYTQHTDDVSSVAWSPNGKEIVSGSWDHTAKVWVVTGF